MYLCLKNQQYSSGAYTILPVKEEDMEQIRQWRNEQMSILRQKTTLSKEQQELYFTAEVLPSFNLDQPLNILFSFFKDSLLIGYGGLVHLNWKENSGEISFLLGSPNSHEVAILIQLLLEVAFQDLKLETVTAEVYDGAEERKQALEQAQFIQTQAITRSSTFYKRCRPKQSL